MSSAGYIRLKRFRDRKRAAADPIVAYCRAVIEWDAREKTPSSGRLALMASDIIDIYSQHHSTEKSVAELMGFGTGRAAKMENSPIARDALKRAQDEMAQGKPSERSVRAGLHHAKRLTAVQKKTVNDAAQLAMFRATAGFFPGHDHSLAPREKGWAWDCCPGYPLDEWATPGNAQYRDPEYIRAELAKRGVDPR
jgi:hypothetical protein